MTDILTKRNSELGSSELQPPRPRRPSPRPRPETLHSEITESDKPKFDLSALAERARAFWTPPALLTERRSAAEQMRAYARRARYTPHLSGPRRALGIAWCDGVAVPYTAWSRTKEWAVERPARYLTIAGTVKALSELPPVEWAVDNVIKPGADFALWLFL